MRYGWCYLRCNQPRSVAQRPRPTAESLHAGRRPRYANAYRYSIPPTISSRIDSVSNSNEVHNIFALFPIPYSLFPKH
ncbi:MAG: hypothetical protein F6K56_00520 [Moorea sp. SIO3G5]|nr:hypothetical protein [Moorena sp. SIO3G5]